MLNLLNGDEKRGIVILSSKEYRLLKHALFDLEVEACCIQTVTSVLSVSSDLSISDKTDAVSAKRHAETALACVDKAKDILR
jgi:hypothetical protein